jgi:hypothetical protein
MHFQLNYAHSRFAPHFQLFTLWQRFNIKWHKPVQINGVRVKSSYQLGAFPKSRTFLERNIEK